MTTGIAALGIAKTASDFVGGLPTKLILLVIALAAIAGGYFWIDHIVSQNAQLKANQAVLTGAVAEQKQTIQAATTRLGEFKDAEKQIRQDIQDLTKAQQDATAETRRLNDVLSKHDLSKLAGAKPALVEHAVNAGTARSLQLLECASGSHDKACGPAQAGGGDSPPRP